MDLGIAMSYSAGACVHAFALFTYEPHYFILLLLGS